MSKIIGIDLGTSTSEVACLQDGKPILIPNLHGGRITPSIVYINAEGEIKVGEDASSYAVLEPENTVIEVKRLMGAGETLRIGGKTMRPQEVSACILTYLKQSAEIFLGEPVAEAVITVPAYFTNEQRVATKEAGELAGFRVERIINEPTAAALAYGLEHMRDQKHVLVYDLGGGTLDVTILEMFEGVLDVKASCGNNQLGGKEFDEAIIAALTSEFQNEHGLSLRENRKAMARLKEAAEKAKIELSSARTALIDLPFLAAREDGKPVGMHREITRKELERLIGAMVRSTMTQVDTVLADAGLKPDDIGTILLVGGSTRIPLVKKVLSEKMGQEPLPEVNPDEAVALGAAIQAGIKSGELAGENDIIITDVCPYSLGIECAMNLGDFSMPGFLDVLIVRNTTIPVSAKKRYQTYSDDQEEAHIHVYQGERLIAAENNCIGDFLIGGIPVAAAGEEKLDVEFSYDINGILEVNATVVKTGADARITIDTSGIKPEAEIDPETWRETKYAKRIKPLIRKTEKKIGSLKEDSDFRAELEYLLYELKYAMVKAYEAHVRKFEDILTDRLYGAED